MTDMADLATKEELQKVREELQEVKKELRELRKTVAWVERECIGRLPAR